MDTALETQQLQKESANTLALATQFQIADNEGYQEAGGMLKGIMGLRKKIGDTFDPLIKKAYESHKAIVAAKKKHETPLVEAEGILKRRMLGYQQEQETARREEEARQRAAAEKEAAEIRAKAARAQAEADAKALELHRKAQEALEAQRRAEAEGNARAAAAAAARAAEATSKAESIAQAGAEKAATLNIQADTIPTPIVMRETPKVAGVSTRKTYAAKVTDLRKLAVAVGAGTVPANVIMPDMAVLNGLARALKEGFSYPGCELVIGETMASRSE